MSGNIFPSLNCSKGKKNVKYLFGSVDTAYSLDNFELFKKNNHSVNNLCFEYSAAKTGLFTKRGVSFLIDEKLPSLT